jgi:FkbM family methyltransferase
MKSDICQNKNEYGRMALRDRFHDLYQLVKNEKPVIIDGGAHSGSIIDKFLMLFSNPIIYAFEPIPDLAKRLNEKYFENSNITIFEKALGSLNCPCNFNITNNVVSSSIMNPGRWLLKYHGDKMKIEETIEIEQTRLDSLEEIKNIEIDIVKLDLQGYELEALKGMQGMFDKIRTITTEVEFIPLYKDQPLFSDIDYFLRQNNFHLFNLYELYTQKDGQLTAGDAVYVNNRY